MTEVTVNSFAEVIGVEPERLLEQLCNAGITGKQIGDPISEKEKAELLSYLRGKHGRDQEVEPRRVILKRRSVGEVQITTPAAKGLRSKPRTKTISVEYRQRKVYMKRGASPEELQQPREEEIAAPDKVADEQIKEKTTVLQPNPETEAPSVVAAETAPLEKKENAEEVPSSVKPVESPPVAPVAAAVPVIPVVNKPPAKDKERDRKTRGKNRHRNTDDHMGRQELHVTGSRARRRKRVNFNAVRSPVDISQQSRSHSFAKPVEPVVRQIEIPEEGIAVSELARRLSVKSSELIKLLMNLGSMATINETLDQETATLLVEEIGHTVKSIKIKKHLLEQEVLTDAHEGREKCTRPPIVTVMGHVDHGKTSLLDHIRKTRVTAKESGGITQHIGAYQAQTPKGGAITFLDTPGHAAFTAMRARGSRVTDIVILVVAADDGVMPQTIEAIEHARAAKAPIIVAINKIDKPDADPDRVEQELGQHKVIPEKWGGDVQFVHLSAKTGKGVDDLLDTIVLQAEILELSAVAEGSAAGVVIESQLDKGRGPIITVLIRRGCLKQGDLVLCGSYWGRVKTMTGEDGRELSSATPSTPVQVQGLSGVPDAGEEMLVVQNERKAREIAALREETLRDRKLTKRSLKTVDLMTQMEENKETIVLNVLLRADVQGSAEALTEALRGIEQEKVKINVVSSGIGAITESDANLAMASNCFVLGFNVRADVTARRLIEKNKIEMRYYSVIYDLVDDVKKLCSDLVPPEIHEQVIGMAEVREVFRSPKYGNIAGCMVVSGLVKRQNPIRVLRDNIVIYEGALESLRRFKEDANEVKSGMECGIGVKNYNDVQPGDQIEVFSRVTVTAND